MWVALGGAKLATVGAMNVPDDLLYSTDHEWIQISGNRARIGITDYAQDALGDVVYVQVPDVGTAVTSGDSFSEVESTKSVSDIYAPVSGVVAEVNDELGSTSGGHQRRSVRCRLVVRSSKCRHRPSRSTARRECLPFTDRKLRYARRGLRVLQRLRASQSAPSPTSARHAARRSTSWPTTRSRSPRSIHCSTRRVQPTTYTSISATVPADGGVLIVRSGAQAGERSRSRDRRHPTRSASRQRDHARRHHRVAPTRRSGAHRRRLRRA